MIRNLRELLQFPKSRQEAACSLKQRQVLLHTRHSGSSARHLAAAISSTILDHALSAADGSDRPTSLYLAQLAERLGSHALENIGY